MDAFSLCKFWLALTITLNLAIFYFSQRIFVLTGEQWLLPPSLDELVPQNHFVRIVSKKVDELEIEEVFAQNTKGGRASRYNPVILLNVVSALKNISLTEQN